MSGLVSYGGDPNIVASRAEIERISGSLSVVQQRLIDELQPLAQLNGLIQHIQFDIELPETLIRLGLQRHGCFVASESYFTADARIAHQLNGLAEALHANPWATRLIPKEAWAALAGVSVAGAFTNSSITAHALRAGIGQLPTEQLPVLTSFIPNQRVTLTEKAAGPLPGPTNLHQLTSRLNNKSGNIRIEGYENKEGRVLVVYLPGTSNWNPIGKGSAFDLQSNLELIGDAEKSNSVRAANQALNAYGIKPDDRLVLVGYSQGGMVAAELAENLANVTGVVTIGAPTARSNFPANLPVVSLEHTNDIVPACSGATNPITENWVTASRHLELTPGQTVGEAHKIENYLNTARLADASNDLGLVRVKALLFEQLREGEPLAPEEYSATKESLEP